VLIDNITEFETVVVTVVLIVVVVVSVAVDVVVVGQIIISSGCVGMTISCSAK
jgi:hypothetical protein